MTDEALEARRKYRREHYRLNADKVKAYQRRWRRANPDKVRAYQDNYWRKRADENNSSDIPS